MHRLFSRDLDRCAA